MTGLSVMRTSFFTTGNSSLGPREQLTPTTSASGEAVSAKDSTPQPVNVRSPSANVMHAMTGRSQFSRAASRAARSSARSLIVSTSTTSASRPARTARAYTS